MKEYFGGTNIGKTDGNVVDVTESRSMNIPADVLERVNRRNREAAENRALEVADDSESIRAYMVKRLSETL